MQSSKSKLILCSFGLLSFFFGFGSASAQTNTQSRPAPSFTVSLAAIPSTVTSGDTSVLSWSTANADLCTATGDWSGTRPNSGTEAVGPFFGTARYTLICTGSGGIASSTADIAYQAPSAPASGSQNGTGGAQSGGIQTSSGGSTGSSYGTTQIYNNSGASQSSVTNTSSGDFQLVPCQGVVKNAGDVECNYNTLITGINNVVKYFLILIIPILTLMIIYAGFLYFGATDNPGKKEQAIHMLKNVAIGVFWVFFGYLIVYSLLKWLIPADNNPFLNGKSVEDVIQLKN